MNLKLLKKDKYSGVRVDNWLDSKRHGKTALSKDPKAMDFLRHALSAEGKLTPSLNIGKAGLKCCFLIHINFFYFKHLLQILSVSASILENFTTGIESIL